MKVAEAMTANVQVALPDMDIGHAARLMAELDVGILPVVEAGRLVGIVTDRDIAVRGTALRLGPETKVAAVMSPRPRFCWIDDDLRDAVTGMARLQVRRLPVLDRALRLVGILSLSDIVVEVPAAAAGEALLDITEPGGLHSQSDDADPYNPVAPALDEAGESEPAAAFPEALHVSAGSVN